MEKIGRVYKIYSTAAPEKIYIGSTYQTLEKRLYAHKAAFASGRDHKFYQFVREVGCDTLVIEKILFIPQVRKELLRELEGHFCRAYDSVANGLNTLMPGRSAVDWRAENRERLRAYYKGYYAANREKEIARAKRNYRSSLNATTTTAAINI